MSSSNTTTAAYSKDSQIIIVGGGVFGLSNAYHLAQNGYKNVTVYDRLDLLEAKYTFLNGVDTASCDINKIFRVQYGDKVHYQRLATKAGEVFEHWDRDIKFLPDEEASKYTGLTILDRVGGLRLDEGDKEFSEEEKKNLKTAELEGTRPFLFDINNSEDIRRAKVIGWGHKLNACTTVVERGKVSKGLSGILDITTGILYASRACMYVNYLCRRWVSSLSWVEKRGLFQKFIMEDKNIIKGIITADGIEHLADLVVMATGPWTTSLVPELDGINEGTQGNIVIFKIPNGRKDLLLKYSPKNFPILEWKCEHDSEKDYMSGLIVFPVMEPEGYLKIICRQTKYTNPIQIDNNRVVSIPRTTNSDPPTNMITKHILKQVKNFLIIFFPDLVQAGIQLKSKLLWYTDTINNDFIYDFVPGRQNLFVSCGGSGHAFKMLPVLGEFLVDKIENKTNFYTELFKWRYAKDFEDDINGLREGLDGPRVFNKTERATEEDLEFSDVEEKIENLKL